MLNIFKKKEFTKTSHNHADANDYLPIGSIVVLKEGTKKLMIFGIIQEDSNDKNSKEYDYIAVLYPEGNIGQEFQYLFNEHDINKVICRGYEDDERAEFLDRLQKQL